MATEMRSERLKAHEKMRNEVRNAVKEQMLTEGFSRGELRKLIVEEIKSEVEKAISGDAVRKALREVVREEVARLAGSPTRGSDYITSTTRTLLNEEIEAAAKEFVEMHLSIESKFKNKEHGAW